MRAKGATYEEIAASGGGIRSTVRKTRAATEDELVATGAKARALVPAMRNDDGGSEVRLRFIGRGRAEDSARDSTTERGKPDRVHSDISRRARRAGGISRTPRSNMSSWSSRNVAARGGRTIRGKLRHFLRAADISRSRTREKILSAAQRARLAAADACRSADGFRRSLAGGRACARQRRIISSRQKTAGIAAMAEAKVQPVLVARARFMR